MTQSIKHFGTFCAVAQPASNSWLYAEDGLVIGSSLVAPDKVTHHIPVMNLWDTTRTLHEGTQLGGIYTVESFKHVQEMLWMDSDLSDWESDDDELTDVLATGITGKSVSAKTPRANALDEARMDPKDLREHLQPLMEWISEYITTREREELAAAIYEYRDVFSSGLEDMGQTDLVTYTIDTGEHRPICLPYVTCKDAYPLPWIDNTLDALRGSQYFSTLDLYLGYWQVKMDSSLYSCLIDPDDVIVYGGNFYDALDRLEIVCQRIREANLKLKSSKCCLMCGRVPFLGQYVSCEGVEVDPMKTAAV